MIARSPTVYVVIVNFNRWRDTAECLESVLRSDYEHVRVIVVDNASTDDSRAGLVSWAEGRWPYAPIRATALSDKSQPPVAKPVDYLVVEAADARDALRARGNEFPKLTLLMAAANRGFAAGNNAAFRLLLDAQADGCVCMVNNDMVIAPDAVRAMVRALQRDDRIAAVGGVILDYQSPQLVQVIGGGEMSRLGMSRVWGAGDLATEMTLPPSLGYVTGGFLLTRIDTLRAVGLMDESYFLYAEDADWGERMREQGYVLACTLDAVVWHKGSLTTVSGSPFQDYHIVRSSLRFVRKNAPVFLPLAVPNLLARCLAPKLLRGEWSRARSVAKAHLDDLLGT
jgi:GT2 family glycosyltransferase